MSARRARIVNEFAQPATLVARSSAIALALGVMLFSSACERAESPRASGEAAAAKPPLVVFGLDAGTWDLLDPWIARGLLPNLAKLRAGGASGPLRSTQPSSSPVIWTSIATGKVPDKTGITWFVRFPNGPGKPVPVDRRQLKTNTLWSIMSRERIDVAVLGWYVTWPAAEVNGRLLSDLAHFGDLQASRWPPDYLFDLAPVPEKDAVAAMPRFMTFDYDAEKATKPRPGEAPTLDYLVYDRFLRAWTRDRFYLDAAERTLSDGPLPEAFFLYLRGTDDVQHGFWKFMDPEAFRPRKDANGKPVGGTIDVPPEQVAAFGKVIERYWQWIDESVGKLLRHYERDPARPPLVIVCSDHGAGPATGEYRVEVPEYLHLSGSHRLDGIVIANGPGIRRGAKIDGATIYDIAPTILAAMGLAVGKDMDGHVLTELFETAPESRTIETWDTAKSAAPAEPELPAAVDEKMLEHMRSLGYIDQ